MQSIHTRYAIKLFIRKRGTQPSTAYIHNAQLSNRATHKAQKPVKAGRDVVIKKTKKARFPYSFSPDELGPDEDFLLDVSEFLTPHAVAVVMSRESLQHNFDFWLSRKDSMTPAELQNHHEYFAKLSKECNEACEQKVKIIQDRDTCIDSCCMLAVLGKLLYGIPLRIRPLDEEDKERKRSRDFAGASSSIPLPDPKPAPSPLGNIGGYELHCRLEEGGPMHVVHLPLDTFTGLKDVVVVLDMSQLLGWPAFLPAPCAYIMSQLNKIKPGFHAGVASAPTELENVMQQLIQEAKEVNPAIVDLMRVGCEKAKEQYFELAVTCASIVCWQQALYNQPIKLTCYPGLEDAVEYDGSVTTFLQLAREECMKALTGKGV